MLHLLLKWMTTVDRVDYGARGGAGGGDNTSQGKLISWHWPRMESNRHWCSRETRQSNRGTAIKKGTCTSADPCLTILSTVKRVYYQNNYHTSPSHMCELYLLYLLGGSGALWHQSAHGRSRQRRDAICCRSCDQIVRMNTVVIQHRARQTGLGYTVFLMSRCYGTRPHDKWHLPSTTQKHAALPNENRWMILPSAAVKSTSLLLTWRPIGVFLFNCLDRCLFSQATTASPGFFFFFFFFTWESQRTSGPMLGYRPNNCTTELLIQWLSNASMHVSWMWWKWCHEKKLQAQQRSGLQGIIICSELVTAHMDRGSARFS